MMIENCLGRTPGWLALIGLAMVPTIAHSDVFRFKDGRIIAGAAKSLPVETINQRPVKVWAVEVEAGVFIRVLESELSNNGHEPLSQERMQYAQNVAGLEQSIETHAALAGECSKHGLTDLARAHFLRILDLDPEYRPARVATGYAQDVNGRWVKKEVVMGENRGKVFVKGRWKFPETLASEEAKEEARRLAGLASRDLRRWHNIAVTGSGGRYDEALRGIAQINDPLTTATLVEFLLDARKPTPALLKLQYINLLSNFQNVTAADALAHASITDPDESVRNACFDGLRSYGRELAIPIYISYLGDKQNAFVNRAAERLGDFQAEGAFMPLVGALITKHIQQNNSPGINASPTSGSFSMGGGGPVELEITNGSVSTTLSRLTGQSFGFDRAAWMAWYASVHAQPAADLRRDL
jgi:hypothetical protein